jgi:cytochrome c biogenesis protein ResB
MRWWRELKYLVRKLNRRRGEQEAEEETQLVSRSMSALSSAPFGIVLLILLIITHMTGNIHHTKYFNLMLALLSLNIINFTLASINHLQAAWRYIVSKELTASPASAMAQDFKEKIELPILGREQLVERAATAARAMKLNIRITPEETRTTIFAERGVWNRLGSYAVHAGLFTMFISGFLNNYLGYAGWMWIEPEKKVRQNCSTSVQRRELDDATCGRPGRTAAALYDRGARHSAEADR